MQTYETGRHYVAMATLAIIAGLGACTSGNIRSEYDPAANFGHYRTYDFFPGAGPAETDIQIVFSKHMVEAISIEMEKRGYVRSGDPDLLINFNAILRDKEKVMVSPAPLTGQYYTYRRGFYDPWPGYGYEPEVRRIEYKEGTFNIDVVDARRQRLVWEAVGQGQVSQKDLEQLDARIYERVPRYFEQYPFTAGSGIARTP